MSKCAWSYDASVEFHIVVELVAWYIYTTPPSLKQQSKVNSSMLSYILLLESDGVVIPPQISHVKPLEFRVQEDTTTLSFVLSFSFLHFGHVICIQKRGYLWLLGQLFWDLSAHYSCDRWAPCHCRAGCLQFPVLRKRHGHWFCLVKHPSLLEHDWKWWCHDTLPLLLLPILSHFS